MTIQSNASFFALKISLRPISFYRMNKYQLSAFFSLTIIVFSCTNDQVEPVLQAQLAYIPENQYYSTEVFKASNARIYGTWKVIGTSGGFHGGGYAPDFEYLLIRPYGIFGMVRNDSLITYGKIRKMEDPDNQLLVQFISAIPPGKINIELVSDGARYVLFRGDSLDLNSPCCDRFNTHLYRVR